LLNRCVLRNVPHFILLTSFSFFVLQLGPTLLAQEPEAPETPTTGTIQGAIHDSDGNPVIGARVLFRSKEELISSAARSSKDGSYVSESLVPGHYSVRVEARNLHSGQMVVEVKAGLAATADFRLDIVDPGPPRAVSRIPGDTVEIQPSNGRNYLDLARVEPGTQVVDASVLAPGGTGYQVLSSGSQWGRTSRYDLDEVEAMDETRGGVIQNLPPDAVRDVIVTRNVPEVFQALNGTGSVRVTTRSAENEWHGDVFGAFRDRAILMAGFPSNDPSYSRQHYGIGVGGAIRKDKAFLFLSGERSKQDGRLPVYPGFPFNFLTTRSAYARENMLTGRFDYNLSENAKMFLRFSYDNASQIGPTDSLAGYRNQFNVPAFAFGMDWNRGHFQHSGRFGFQKMVNAVNPAFDSDALIWPGTEFHQQIGSFELGPSIAGPRQAIQRDIFGRYDASTPFRANHTLRFGAAYHHIEQGDFNHPGDFGPSVTSSNGIDVINAINSNPTFPPFFLGDPRGPADNPLNYPVGTVTIYNGLGNFSEKSAFDRLGGHSGNRMELYAADTFKRHSNLNITLGVNYVRDTGRTNNDLAAVPCSAINTAIVTNAPCTGSTPILQQYGNNTSIGGRVSQPNWNFAPVFGIAWDPGHAGKTVIRLGGGMFFDNFLLENSYQDRVSRLTSGQYARGLSLCPTGVVLFPDGSKVSSVDGLDIASQICGQPIGTVAGALDHLQSDFLASQATVTGGANPYSLASLANFGGMLAPNYRTARVTHLDIGIQRQFGERSSLSVDYVRQVGTQLPLGIDTNHVGDASFYDPVAALQALNATVTAVGCSPALSSGAASQAAVDCYLQKVPSGSITDFARNGLDTSNAYCGAFACSVLGLNRAAFGGINPAVGSNVMFFPTGRSKYQGVQIGFKTTAAMNPMRGVRRLDIAASYTYSKFESNIASPDGSGGDFSVLSVAEDYNSPHTGHFGPSGLDRRNQISVAIAVQSRRGPKLSMISQLVSPLPLTVYLPQRNGGGVAGEIYRTDLTGDGTVGDVVLGTSIGGLGGYSGSDLKKVIATFNTTYGGALGPAGGALVSTHQVNNITIAPLMTTQQVSRLGATVPFINPELPGHFAEPTWLKTIDFRFSWPLRVGERVQVEPTISAFNVFNLANFGGPGRQLSGILDGSPGSSSNNSSTAGFCGGAPGLCTSRLDRIVPGSGTYGYAAPRQVEIGVRVTF